MGSGPDAELSCSAIFLPQTTSLSSVFLSLDSATSFASSGCFKVVLSLWYCSVSPHLWRCCPPVWITSLLLGTSCSSPSRVVIGLSWEVGAREEGGKERKEQKGTQRPKAGEGSQSGAILGKWHSQENPQVGNLLGNDLRPWLLPGVKFLPKLPLEHECYLQSVRTSLWPVTSAATN